MKKMMNNELMELLESKCFPRLKKRLDGMNPVDAAAFLDQLPEEKRPLVFRLLDKDLATDVFAQLAPEAGRTLVDSFSDGEAAQMVEELAVDDAVDLLGELPATVVKRILQGTSPQTRELVNRYLCYPDGTAGSIMTAEFTELSARMTVAQAIAHIRSTGQDKETIYTCYVTGPCRVLEGVVSVRELLLARDEQLVEALMDRQVIRAVTTDGQEEVAQLLSRYDLLSLPVVDRENRLVGIVTVDDAVEVLEQETTEDFEKMAAMAPSDDRPYLRTGVVTLARRRIVWLLVLMISGMVTGSILAKYEAAFAAMPLLVTFIPMLTDTGGNAGSQSSTLVIRGMTLGEIRPRDLLAVLWKETRVSLLVGVVLAAVNYLRLVITYPGQEMMALTVSLSLVVTVLMAKTIGGVLPIVARSLRIDPAIMAAPLITTIVDAVSLVVYFSIAHHLLGV